jgi:DnaJ-class molecular chaperone
VSGKGEIEAGQGNVAGDLYIRVRVNADATFKKEKSIVYMTQHISLSTALVGADIQIKSFDQEFVLAIPHGINSGDVLRAKEKGGIIDSAQGQGKRGDMMITIKIDMPKKVSGDIKEAAALLKKAGY